MKFEDKLNRAITSAFKIKANGRSLYDLKHLNLTKPQIGLVHLAIDSLSQLLFDEITDSGEHGLYTYTHYPSEPGFGGSETFLHHQPSDKSINTDVARKVILDSVKKQQAEPFWGGRYDGIDLPNLSDSDVETITEIAESEAYDAINAPEPDTTDLY